MKRVCLLVISWMLLAVCCMPAEAATLKKIRYKPYEDKVRVVFDLDGEVYYQVSRKDRGFIVRLLNCGAENEEHSVYNIKDWVVRELEVKKQGKDMVVYFPLEYPVEYKVYPLPEPSRLVVDFGREFSKVEKTERISDGLDYSYITKGTSSGFVSAHVLAADPKKTNIFPALAAASPGFFQSVMNVFTPWEKMGRAPFSRDKVSAIADKYNAVAGINGTYFSPASLPLGVLVINGELISYPIYNRTALILDDKGNAAIDQVMLDGYIEIDGARYQITGVNEPRDNNDVIVFTKHYGETTGTNRYGYELTVKNGRVSDGRIGNSVIPDSGYVVSFSPMFVEHIFSKVKINDRAKVFLQIVPYSNKMKYPVLHVLGGGPRLLKKGHVYITKNFEKFQPDIALGLAARSAVGITRDGKVLLVAVDGKPRRRSPYHGAQETYSRGMTLEELARLMLSIGAVDALNLDGGGSSSMVINGKTINRPADGSLRPVSNALLVKPLE